jgi:hypothetical protein
MTNRETRAKRRSLQLAVLVTLAAALGACQGITPMKSYPVPGSEMDPNHPGILSGDDGAFILYEKK